MKPYTEYIDMTKNYLLLGMIVAVIIFAANKLHARYSPFDTSEMNKPVVIELFTSQSCSSCPPADKNLSKLAQSPNIIALGFHVTYWDHLSWKDTLSKRFSTDRQRSYSRYSGKSRVYTPQMVVNGTREFVGSRGGDIAKALKNATPVEPLNVSIDGNNILTLILPELKEGDYTLWVAGIQNEHEQSIPSGENRGRTVTYTNAVLDYASAGQWNGKAETRQFEAFTAEGIDHYIVLAQEKGYGPIAAAGQTE